MESLYMTQVISSKPRRPLWKRLLLIFTVMVSLVAGAAFALLAGAANPLLNRYVDEISAAVSADLGRPLSVRSVQLSVFPWCIFHLNGVEVEGLAQVEAIKVEIDTWRALVSLGQELSVDEVSVNGATVSLSRDAQGVWNYASRAPADPQRAEAEIPKAKTPEADAPQAESLQAESPQADAKPTRSLRSLLRSIHLKDVHMRDLKVTLHDELTRAGEPPVTLVDLDLELPTLDLAHEIEAEVTGELLDSAEPVSLTLKLGPYGSLLERLESGSGAPDPMMILSELALSVTMSASELKLSHLEPLLGKQGAMIRRSRTGGSIKLQLTPGEGVSVSGHWQISDLALNNAQGEPRLISAALKPNVEISLSPDRRAVILNGTSVVIDGMSLQLLGGVILDQQGLQLKGLGIKTDRLSLEKVNALAPQLSASLPPQSTLSGPLNISAQTSGGALAQRLNVKVSLDGAEIMLPEQLVKHAGVPLNLDLNVGVTPSALKINALNVHLGDATLSVEGTVNPHPRSLGVNLKATVAPVDLLALARLSPALEGSLAQAQSAGTLSVESALKLKMSSGELSDLNVNVHSAIKGATLKTPEARVIGNGELKLDLQAAPSGDFAVNLSGDLTELDLKLGDALNKPARLPLRLALQAHQKSGRLELPVFDVQVAQLKLNARGERDANSFRLNAQLKPTRVWSALAMLKSSRSLGADMRRAKLGFKLDLSSQSGSISDLQLHLSDLKFNTSKSDLKADVLVKRSVGSPISVTARLQSNKLNLDALFPPREGRAATAAQGAQSSRSAPSREASSSAAAQPQGGADATRSPSVQANISAHVKRGVARGVKFKTLKFNTTLDARGVYVNEASVKVFGGVAKVHPLWLKTERTAHGVSDQELAWSAGLELENINLARASREISGDAPLIEGLISGGFKVEGRGLSWDQIASSLMGEGRLSLRRGAIKQLKLERMLLKGISERVGLKLGKRRRARPLKLKTLSGALKIEQGTLNFKQALKSESPDGSITALGTVGLDGALDLQTQLTVSAQRISSLIKRRISSPASFPLNFRLLGSIRDPKLGGLNATLLITAIAAAYGISQLDLDKASATIKRELKSAKRAIKRQAKEVEKQAKREVKRQVKRVKEKAQQVKARAQAEVDQAKERAEREAKRLEREARQEAKRQERALKRKRREAEEKAKRELERGAERLKGMF